MTGQFLSVKKFAAKYDFSEYFVRNMIKQGVFPVVKSGIKYYIDDDAAIRRLRGGDLS